MTTGVAIMTLNAARDLPRLLPLVLAEDADRVVVFDSESNDGTPKMLDQYSGVELVTVKRKNFNHGATREFARKHLGTDILVLLTQDVIPCRGWLPALIKPLINKEAVTSYARQLPHLGADLFEAYPREFNYPGKSQRRVLSDTATLGVHTFFSSDSCSAYLNSALDEVGGFEPTLTSEDYFAVARLLQAGGAICYAAEAEVHHSHRYTLRQEFQRYFDTGYVRAERPWVTEMVGHAEKRGSEMAKGFLPRVIRQAPLMFPYALLQLAAKWLGYRLGHLAYRWPRHWCRRFSSQRYYWDSDYCRHPRQ